MKGGFGKQFAGLISGLLGGAMGGFLGVGGGVITIPLLTRFAGLTQHQAHGSSLFAIMFTAAVGAGTYYIQGNADWKVALIVAGSAIFTARIGALFAHALPEKKLKRAFGFFLILVAFMLVFKGYFPGTAYRFDFWGRSILFLATGSFAGFLSGMMGVGGGAIMVPCMVILGSMTQHMAQGTSLLAMVPIAASGMRTHYRLGNVRMDTALGLAAGAIMGGYIGALLARTLPELYLRILFSALGLWMGFRYVRA